MKGNLRRLSNYILRIGEGVLDVQEPLDKADGIVVLAGGNGSRERHAAALYRWGYAPAVVTTQARTDVLGHSIRLERLARHNLRQACVPDEAILVVPGEVSTTSEEAQRFSTFARSRGWQKAIVVTDASHARRAGLAFRRALSGSDIRVYMSSSGRIISEREDWSLARKFHSLFLEYLKLFYYFVKS